MVANVSALLLRLPFDPAVFSVGFTVVACCPQNHPFQTALFEYLVSLTVV